jgi:superfamily II DNA helicase RecQ
MFSQSKIFPIPMHQPSEIEKQLNQFLCMHKVLTIQKEFRVEQDRNYVCFVVEYLTNNQVPTEQANQIDYKEILTPDEFQLFLQLKDWRKKMGEKLNGVPLYTIFTNEQFSNICQKRVKTKSDLQKINGVGEGKVNNYGDTVIKMVSDYFKEDAPSEDNKEKKGET